jgi:hypothetical protein
MMGIWRLPETALKWSATAKRERKWKKRTILWMKEIRSSTKENIVFFHLCYALCGKWDTCDGETKCIEDIEIVFSVWR